MTEYNPFEGVNPLFSTYKQLKDIEDYDEQKKPLITKIPLFDDNGLELSGFSRITDTGIPIADPNTSETAEFDKDIFNRMASTHAENYVNSGKANKISLKGSENLSKVIDEVSNEKGFEELKDPNIKRLILLQAKRESSFNPTVQSKSSSASGYFQFIDSTRKRYSNYSKTDFLKDQKEQVRAAYKYLQDIHNTPSALKLKQQGYNDAFITALGWWYPRSMDMVLQGKKDFSLGGYSIKKALEDYG